MKSMLKTLSAVIISCLIISVSGISSILAHTTNEASQFPDIEFSESRFDIVVLVGAGIIPETPVFEPDLPMSRKELAVWAALYNNLGPGGETPDTDALAKSALAAGLVESFDGLATYADINSLFFDGLLTPASPEATPTKGEAASYIASMLSLPPGESLLAKRGLQVGPVGEVVSVESRTNPDGGSSYYITIGGLTLPMYAHGRVANGPTDLLLWQDRSVRRSFIRKQGDFKLWEYFEASDLTSDSTEKSDHNHMQHNH